MRALINGAGIAGLACAWWLGRDGHDVTVLERAPARRGAGYMIDCSGEGYRALERMGLLAHLTGRAFTLTELVYHHPDGSEEQRFGETDDDAPTVSVMREDFEDVLHEALHPHTEVRFATGVAAVPEVTGDGVTVTLTDGTREHVDLLLGADGLRSRIRALVFGSEEQFVRRLGFHTAAYDFHDAALAARLGSALHVVETPGRHMGVYPAGGDHIGAFLTHRVRPGTPIPADPRAELRRIHRHGTCVDRVLEHLPVPGELYYDEVAQVHLPSWRRGRVGLVGDACHAMSLLTGHGAGTALASAAVLADALRTTHDPAEALTAYERHAKPAVDRLQAEGRAAADEFVADGFADG